MTNKEAIEILKCILENLIIQSRGNGKTTMCLRMQAAIIKAIDALDVDQKIESKNGLKVR